MVKVGFGRIGKLTSDAALDPPGLVVIAVAHAFALFVGVSVAANISGGHLNPAVTLGWPSAGTLPSSQAFSIGSPNASAPSSLASSSNTLLAPCYERTNSQSSLQSERSGRIRDGDRDNVFSGLHRLRNGGFIVGFNILAARPFSSGSINPATSFGPAAVSGNYSEIWIYWAGPLVGGSFAGLVYGDIFIGSYAPLPNQDYV